MDALEIGRIFLHEIPESRLPLWSHDVWAAVMLAEEEEERLTPHHRAHRRRRGGRRAKNAKQAR